MSKRMALWIIVLIFIASGAALASNAQEENKPSADENKAAEHRVESGKPGLPGGTQRPIHPYRVDFLITELEDGKKINSRRYTMLVNAGDWSEVRIGTRVPSGPDAPGQFVDVGTSINCRLTESNSDLSVSVHGDFSNFFSIPNQEHQGKPIIRQILIQGNTIVSPGKPVIIGIVDDPNSDRQFQLEATVTNLR